MEPRPLIELNVQQAIASILQKPRWWDKWQDDTIRERWISEVEQQFLVKTFDQSLASWSHGREPIYALRYILEEPLLAKREMLSADMKVTIYPAGVDGVWISDNIISDEMAVKFKREVAVLENVPDDEQDWHPDSKQQVLDLVHPSLFCCVFGKTLRTSTALDPSSFSTPLEQMNRLMFSGSEVVENASGCRTDYQWIPTDFLVTEGGEPGSDSDISVRTLSYINNLHPGQHGDLYDSIEKIFAKFVPLFERMLNDQEEGLPRSTFRANMQCHDTSRELPPRPKVPKLTKLPKKSVTISLRGKTLQIIVKIAEIILTPENPKYKGGAWHIEGTLAENIVGTGIYYFGCENIKDSRLAFRAEVEEPPYQQNDDDGVAEIYGLFSNSLLVQKLGIVETPDARCVVFPNSLQHQVQQFQLDDPSRPGVRKILAFFLIDPENSIPSTSVIPPQQQEWMKMPMNLTDVDAVQANIEAMLPKKMTLEEAKEHRLKLMKERSVKQLDEDEREGDSRYFSLCEH
ncbi:hypothetical protein PHMEG_00030835 [Phytophthora megakarya]|uniref:DUF4246 domain-containing protein n=1 Tax=Phytophthora megakarya TaxID=4795 RepID=A0A225UZ71_9STRA|nr:hypothetical protein PHMEG_00030835 [Phytophthora megakarya]